MLYRHFGYLLSRILLDKQDGLRCLEEQLDQLDTEEKYDQADRLLRRTSQGEQRRRLLSDTGRKFCEYFQIMGAAQKLMFANRPTASEHKSVPNFIAENRVAAKEAEYVCWKEDLITLRPGRQNAWLDRGIEKVLKLLHCNALEYIFGSKVCESDPVFVRITKDARPSLDQPFELDLTDGFDSTY
ncbi:hypothetical protein DOTSEDRAFT_26141 [Dothistroma septosporum NZE10]|uniref:DUF6594 domain-containing protein n=1 Tax=Dothistroma septosporum (strain NZE10 / CBS 128990) TaxID=675120 RepID=N1PLY4_DOTSN|nr:hypothetical protein DOTSEDRAFT_26141 [Dothistroma septosporum NZE10]